MHKGPANWHDDGPIPRARRRPVIKPTPEVVVKLAPILMAATDNELLEAQAYLRQLINYRRTTRA